MFLYALPLVTWHTIPIGPLKIQVWGLMVAFGFLVGILAASYLAKKRRLDRQKIYDIAVWLIIGSFIGGRILYLFEDIGYFADNPIEMLKIWRGGMSITGGLLGALIAYLLYIHRKKLSFWLYAEPLMFGLPLGIGCGRIGCALIHDHPGRETTLPWGVDFGDGKILHEPAYYLILKGLLIFLFFLIMRRRPIAQKEGFYTSSFLILYGFSRFFLDFTRDSTVDYRFLGLTIAQYFDIVFFLAGLILFYLKIIKHPKPSLQELAKKSLA